MDRVKTKINSCGVDGITEQELIEMKYWTCVADAMTSYDYHYKIIEEMEKPENEYGVNYDENGRFYTRGTMKRGYDNTDVNHRMYNSNDKHAPEYYRDMDRESMGNMYYSEMPRHESRYDRARRGYEEAKMKHTGDDPENMSAIETIFDVLESDIKELKPKMTSSELSRVKTRLSGLSSMM